MQLKSIPKGVEKGCQKPCRKKTHFQAILGWFFIDFWAVFKAILELMRATFQSFLANPRYLNSTVKPMVLRQKWHIRKTEFNNKLSQKSFGRLPKTTSKTHAKKDENSDQFSVDFGTQNRTQIGQNGIKNRDPKKNETWSENRAGSTQFLELPDGMRGAPGGI